MKISSFCSITTLVLVLLSPPVFSATEIRLYSEDGERIGEGNTFILTQDNGSLTVGTGETEGVILEWQNPPDEAFSLSFAAANSQQLSPGEYLNAQKYPHFDADIPALYIEGNGNYCTGLSGSFEVYEVEYDQNGVITKLALDAIQNCELWQPKLTAIVRFNSDVPFEVGPRLSIDDDFVVQPGAQVTAGVISATTTNGVIESISWQQEYGLPVVLAGADTNSISFSAPISDADYEVLVFTATVTDTAGETASDEITIIASETTTVISRYRFEDFTPGAADPGPSEVNMDPSFVGSVRNFNGLFFNYVPPDDDSGWSIYVGPPEGESLEVGQYHNVYQPSFSAENRPKMDLTKEPGFGCSRLIGRFDVLDIGRAENTAVNRLALNAVLQCLSAGVNAWGPIEFRVRHNTVVPIDSRAPISNPGSDWVVPHGDTTILDGRLSQVDTNAIQSYDWQQLSGPAVAIADADQEIASFLAPDVPQGEGESVFELTITDTTGLSDSEEIVVDVRGSADPINIIDLHLPTGTGFDYVTYSSGFDHRFDDNTTSFSASKGPTKTQLSIREFAQWSFEFASDGTPRAQDPNLTVGLFENAGRFEDGQPLMVVSGEGRGCNDTYGQFVVHEIVEDVDGTPTSMAIDFEQSCDTRATLFGKIRYNSTIPLEAPGLFASAGQDIQTVPGQLVELDAGRSYVGPSTNVEYSWEQISGPAVAIIGSDQERASFVTPAAAGTAVFRVTITTAEGLTDTAIVSTEFLGPNMPLSGLYIFGETGDFVSLGARHYFGPDEVGTGGYSTDEYAISYDVDRFYHLKLFAPEGELLTLGDYVNTYDAAHVPGFPGLSLQMAFRRCDSPVGWFRLREIVPAANGYTVDKLAADFYHTCDYGEPALMGALRVNSTLPLREPEPVVTAGPSLSGRTGTSIQLSAEQSFSWDSNIVGYQWQQVSGSAASITNAASVTPSVLLPSLATGTEQLVFEVTGTDANGLQGTAQTTVTVLGLDAPSSELNLVLFDPQDGSEIARHHYDANNSYFGVTDAPARIDATALGRDLDIHARFDARILLAPLAEGILHWRDSDDDRPDLSVGTTPGYTCSSYSPAWLHITDVQTSGDNIVSMAYESEHYCTEDLGMRLSARLNSSVPLEFGNVVLIATADRPVTEGDTVYIDDAIAYAEGEVANVAWQQVSGPNVRLATIPNARTSFVVPATNGGDEITLRLSITTDDQQTNFEDVRFALQDNGISGFPAAAIPVRTVAGTYDATGDPVAISSNHLVILHPRSPNDVNGSDEPETAPYGILETEFDTAPGETISFTVHFPDPVPSDSNWLLKTVTGSWREHTENWTLASDRRSVTVDMTDGGPSDMDQLANGRIIVSGGISAPRVFTPPPPPPPTSSGGGGGGTTGPAIFLMLCIALRLKRRSYSPGCASNVRKRAGL